MWALMGQHWGVPISAPCQGALGLISPVLAIALCKGMLTHNAENKSHTLGMSRTEQNGKDGFPSPAWSHLA